MPQQGSRSARLSPQSMTWDAPPKHVKEEAEISNGVTKVNLGETKSKEGVKTEDTEKTKVVENGGGGDAPRAPTPVLHSYS